MAEGTPKAIEPKGIVRNATKIGVQDGQAEDLINLRFMDGSWRASGNGRQIVNMPTGTIYQQLYVHTNVYHHLLGVNNGTLYWFAEIDNDGVTFYPLDGTSDRTNWPEDMQDLPTEPKRLTEVVGDIWITQTGHLLTVIDESDDFDYLVYKTGENKYIKVEVDANGQPTARSLYPFGQVHFNVLTGDADEYLYKEIDENQKIFLYPMPFDDLSIDLINYEASPAFMPKEDEETTHAAAEIWHSQLLLTLEKAIGDNRFTGAFFACIALKLYDGSYAFASNPILINPREKLSMDKELTMMHNGFQRTSETEEYHPTASPAGWRWVIEEHAISMRDENSFISAEILSNILTGASSIINGGASSPDNKYNAMETCVIGADLSLNISNIELIRDNPNTFEGVGVFVTRQVHPFNTAADDYKKGKVRSRGYFITDTPDPVPPGDRYIQIIGNAMYNPPRKEENEIINELLSSPFYLLRDYTTEEIVSLKSTNKVDISDAKYAGLLKNIVQQKTLETEAFSRTTYLPKVSYMYNGRLHIANYKTHPFFGYPIDLSHLHNHSVKVQDGAWFPADEAGKRVLPNLADNNDAYLQYPCEQMEIKDAAAVGDGGALINAAAPYFLIRVYIETAQGEQIVCRYIPAYDPSAAVSGRADFIEDLNPMLTYPDARAKKMEIYVFDYYLAEDKTTPHHQPSPISKTIQKAGYHLRRAELPLKPHPYLNIAYYIDPDLKPLSLRSFNYPNGRVETHTEESTLYVVYDGLSLNDIKALANMQNTEEYFPNGLKVSKTDQPMFFPVENTYQVGSAEILALMSNTIAVGTGQTGDAPLYVFCKDGVYALYVDSSGQMAYPNARILARDVCNNPRSVTPIDAGVVFTTDRGLMMIAGEQVQEIGAPVEGDVVQFWNAGSVDYSKIATASMQQIAGLPSELCSTTDFLTYLQDKGTSGKAAIINYNHNMRELMVSNPNYPYSYVLDREGNWSRRDYTAAQYVNNYPTSYRVDANGHFYKVDDEGDANTTLEHRKEADNKIFYLSNVIKLDSIGFKQAYRFVVRGQFDGVPCAKGTINGVDVYIYDKGAQFIKNTNFGNIIRLQYKLSWGVVRWVNADSGFPVMIRIINQFTGEDITDTIVSADAEVIYNVTRSTTPIACVVEGSYDGRKFKPLGYNRKSGKFRDIGCIVERTDVRFFRICLSGQVTGKTRIDYMEMSAGASMLNTKIR